MKIKTMEKLFKITHQELMEDATIGRCRYDDGEGVNLEPISKYMVDKYGCKNKAMEKFFKSKRYSFQVVLAKETELNNQSLIMSHSKVIEFQTNYTTGCGADGNFYYCHDYYYFPIDGETKATHNLKITQMLDTNIDVDKSYVRYKQTINAKLNYALIEA